MLILVSLYADRLFQSKLSSRPCKMETLKVSRPAVQVIAYWIKNENGFNQGLNWKYQRRAFRYRLNSEKWAYSRNAPKTSVFG